MRQITARVAIAWSLAYSVERLRVGVGDSITDTWRRIDHDERRRHLAAADLVLLDLERLGYVLRYVGGETE